MPHGFTAVVAEWLLLVSDVSFPRDSWPSAVLCTVSVTVAGQDARVKADLLKLYQSNDGGPICCLITGTLAGWISPPLKSLFTSKGLRLLELKDFRRDYRFLLESPECMKYRESLVRLAGQLDDKEAADLLANIPKEHAVYLTEGLRVLRVHRGQPAKVAVAASLDAMWEHGLRTFVEARLQPMAGPSDSTPVFKEPDIHLGDVFKLPDPHAGRKDKN